MFQKMAGDATYWMILVTKVDDVGIMCILKYAEAASQGCKEAHGARAKMAEDHELPMEANWYIHGCIHEYTFKGFREDSQAHGRRLKKTVNQAKHMVEDCEENLAHGRRWKKVKHMLEDCEESQARGRRW